MFEKLPESLLLREVPRIIVRSSAFENMNSIPAQFTADGDGESPPLEWTGIPSEASSLVLIVEDADSPTAHPLVPAIAVLPASDAYLQRGALPNGDGESAGVQMGLNSFLRPSWLPPDPPPGHGPHHYAFQLFALGGEATTSFDHSLGRQELLEMIFGRAIAAGCLVGTYERVRRQKIEQSDAGIEVPEPGAAPSLA